MIRKWFWAAAAALMLAAVAPVVPATAAPGDDTAGGWVPDGQELSTFDLADPAVNRLTPALLQAIQRAAGGAKADGITLGLTSGWRSPEFQQQLFNDAVARYGSAAIASEYVASPETSKHVIGRAVDVGPTDADTWLIRNGSAYGLCQIYANEIWHFELASDYGGACPPLRPNAAG
ncbi:M15 family metallopeptidase [Mycobacterium gordonae]|uniref:Peptidase M15 n=1 Tax=Mycobacterium gordonae TaxID=1778 RepID=A0A1X1W0C1_MYCGO|nr:M15 family metallopeptidase [Mycobacterium gordonae]ODR22859.1 peptidase M15 [Mycobacterium gordonae]ORV78239.1 peptidase M15 [Mycobacterium gordonae]